MSALIESDALGLEHPALKVGLTGHDAAGRDSSARVDHAMPRYRAGVLRCDVHGPTHEPWAVALLEQTRDLAVSHHPTARDAQYKFVYPLEDTSELVSPPSVATRLANPVTLA